MLKGITMKSLTFGSIILILGLSITTSTQAQKSQNRPIAHFGQISVAGTGCSPNSISSRIGTNTGTLKILFESFDAGMDAYTRLRRAGCSITVPITIPKGFQLSQLNANWMGTIEGKGRLRRKYYFSGRPNTGWKKSTYRKPTRGDFSTQDTISQPSLSTNCEGGTFNLRIVIRLRVFDNKSYMAMDNTDFAGNSGLRLSKLSYKPCR